MMEMILRLRRVGDFRHCRGPLVARLIELLGRSDGGRMLGATVSALVIRALAVASQVGVFALAARSLEMSEVGVYAVINTIWTMWRQLGPLGFDQLTLRAVPAYRAANREDLALAADWFAFRRVLSASLLLALLIMIGQCVVGDGLFRDPVAVLLMSMGLPAQAAIGLLASQMRARERLARSLIPEAIIVQPGLLAAVLVMWCFGSLSLEMLLSAQVALMSVSALLYFFMWIPPPGAAGTLSASDRRRHARLAAEIFASLLANALQARFAPIAVAVMLGPAAAAVMEVAMRIAYISSQITWAVSVAVVQAMSRAIAICDRLHLEKLITVASRLAFIPAATLLVIMVIGGHEVIDLLFGHSFRPAYWPAILVSAAAAINARYTPASLVFLLSGGQKTVLWFTLAALATIISGIVASAALWSEATTEILGASASTLASVIVRDVGLRLVLYRHIEAFSSREVARPTPTYRPASCPPTGDGRR
jgi:O-antigen/teichoic acid export membrane protein